MVCAFALKPYSCFYKMEPLNQHGASFLGCTFKLRNRRRTSSGPRFLGPLRPFKRLCCFYDIDSMLPKRVTKI